MAGNANSGRKQSERWFRDALALEIHDSLKDGDRLKLRRIAAKLVLMAEDGDMQAIKEVADRLDGKPPQSHTHGGDENRPFVHRIERAVVKANAKD